MGQSTESEGFSALMIFSGLISLAGIGLAYQLHLKDRALDDALAERLGPITRLIEAKFWVDEIYQAFIVNPLRMLGEFFYGFDRWVVDMLVNMAGWILPARRLSPEIHNPARLSPGLRRRHAPGHRRHPAVYLYALNELKR